MGSRSVVGVASRPHPQNLSRNLLCFSQSPLLPSTPTYPGDIEVFKGMDLTSLNLYNCFKLTGVFGLGWWGMVGGVKIGNRCCLKASSEELSQEPSSFRTPRALSPPPLPQATSMCSRACRSRSSISLAARRSEVSAWDYAGGVKISSGCCLRASLKELSWEPSPFLLNDVSLASTPLPQATSRCLRACRSRSSTFVRAFSSQVGVYLTV